MQRLLSLKGGCRRRREPHVNPALLSAPTDGNAPLRSCCLVPLAFRPSSCPVAVLLQLIGRAVCSSLLLPRGSKLLVLFPHSLLKSMRCRREEEEASNAVGFGVCFWEKMSRKRDDFFLSETSETEAGLLGTTLFPEIYSNTALACN